MVPMVTWLAFMLCFSFRVFCMVRRLLLVQKRGFCGLPQVVSSIIVFMCCLMLGCFSSRGLGPAPFFLMRPCSSLVGFCRSFLPAVRVFGASFVILWTIVAPPYP